MNDRPDEVDNSKIFNIEGRSFTHDHSHVNLLQDEYTPQEVAHLLGTSLQAIMHAVYSGELKAERAGHDVLCIDRADLVDWMNRRDPRV